MAKSSLSSIHKLLQFISFILPVFSSFCIHTASADTDIHQICPKTRNPTLCVTILGSGKGKTLRDLALASIDAAQESIILVKDQLNVLIKQGVIKKDPSKLRYKLCVGSYELASSCVSDLRQLLNSGNYKGLPAKASSALKESENCDENFTLPPTEPAQLKLAATNFQDVCSVVSVIANLLAADKM